MRCICVAPNSPNSTHRIPNSPNPTHRIPTNFDLHLNSPLRCFYFSCFFYIILYCVILLLSTKKCKCEQNFPSIQNNNAMATCWQWQCNGNPLQSLYTRKPVSAISSKMFWCVISMGASNVFPQAAQASKNRWWCSHQFPLWPFIYKTFTL